jgi:peptide deformylase
MAVYPVIKYGHPSLRKVAAKITDYGEELKTLSEDLIETMQVNAGIGLAATQVNILKRIFVIDLSLINEDLSPSVYINPRIISSQGSDVLEEGCLSIPGVNADVDRSLKTLVEYNNLNGELIQEELDGLHARVFQHELDHLNGVLFVDRISVLQRKMLEPELKKIMEAHSIA